MVGMVVVESQDSSARGQSVIGHFRAGPSGLPFRRDGVHIYISASVLALMRRALRTLELHTRNLSHGFISIQQHSSALLTTQVNMIYRHLVSSQFSSAVGPDAYDVTVKATGQLRGKFRSTSKDSEPDAEEYLAETDEGFLSQDEEADII